jgi:uncharacterized membrane protein
MNKVTETELQKISVIKKDALEYASFLGELEYQKTLIEIDVNDIKSKIKLLRQEESKLFSELKDNYGNININLETGEYTTV